MAFSGNFHDNKKGIISFLESYNQMQRGRGVEIPCDKKADNLYDLLSLQRIENPAALKGQCLILSHAITPCFSGESSDPFLSDVDEVIEALAQGEAGHIIQDWPAPRKASTAHFSDSVSVDSALDEPEDRDEEEEKRIKLARGGHAFMLGYLNRLNEGGFHPDIGAYAPHDPQFAQWLAKKDAPPRPTLTLYNVPETDSSRFTIIEADGRVVVYENEPITQPPLPAQDPLRDQIRAAELFEYFENSYAIAEGTLVSQVARRRERNNFILANTLNLAVPTAACGLGFGAGALIGFGVIKLGVAVIGIAGISFPPILFVAAVAAVTAVIAYACIKKYKKSPFFTRKIREKPPAKEALLFSAPAATDPGKMRYQAFRSFFEMMDQKFNEPITDTTKPSWKNIHACLEYEATSEGRTVNWPSLGWLTELKKNLQEWKLRDRDAVSEADQYQLFSKYFGWIMSDVIVLMGNESDLPQRPHYAKIRSALMQELFSPCTKEMRSFYSNYKNAWQSGRAIQIQQLNVLTTYDDPRNLDQNFGVR